MKYFASILLMYMLSSAALSDESRKGFLADFVLGKYLLIGKKVDSPETYYGHVEIYSEKDELKVKRSIGETLIHGRAAMESALHGDAMVLRMKFDEDGVSYENTCLVQSDLDNYARISCYLYQPGITTMNPGLEALFIKN